MSLSGGESVASLRTSAEERAAGGDYEAAIDLYSRALDVCRRGGRGHDDEIAALSAALLTVRGGLYLKQHDYVRALQDSGSALRLQPGNDDARLVRAGANVARGNTDAAMEDIRIVHEHDASHPGVSALMRGILRAARGGIGADVEGHDIGAGDDQSPKRRSVRVSVDAGAGPAPGPSESWVLIDDNEGAELAPGANHDFEKDLTLKAYWDLHGGPKERHLRIDKYDVWEMVELNYPKQREPLYTLFDGVLSNRIPMSCVVVQTPPPHTIPRTTPGGAVEGGPELLVTPQCWNALMKKYGLLTAVNGLDQLLSRNVREGHGDTPEAILNSIIASLTRIGMVREYVNAYTDWKDVNEATYVGGILKAFRSFPLVSTTLSNH